MSRARLAPLPNALERKYPQASESRAWQFVFPSSVRRPWVDSIQFDLTNWVYLVSLAKLTFKSYKIKVVLLPN